MDHGEKIGPWFTNLSLHLQSVVVIFLQCTINSAYYSSSNIAQGYPPHVVVTFDL